MEQKEGEWMNIQEIIYILAFFFIYSFAGWVLESVTKTVSQKKFVNSGFLNGPFCPIYGLGAVGMAVILHSYQGQYFLTFLISFLVFSVWEYFVGWLLETIFHTKYWDYSYYYLQIHGRVCLINSLTWGFLGVAFTELIHPCMEGIIKTIPVEVINISVFVLGVYVLIDLMLTIIKLKDIKIKIKKFNEINQMLKEKIEERKKISNMVKPNEKLQEKIDELRQKREELRDKIAKQTRRLHEAYPNWKFEKLNEFFKKKNKTE